MASGGEDNTCRIWDLRKRKSLYVIPAHSNLISQVKFEPQEGYFLVTGSYDTTAKVYTYKTVILHMKCVLYAVFSSFACVYSFSDIYYQVWSSRDFKPIRTLSGHEAKVTSLDIAGGVFI